MRASDTEAKTSLVTAQKALETDRFDIRGSYAGATTYRACAKPDTGGCGKAQAIPGFGSPGSW